MPGGQHEPVATGPVGVGGVVPHRLLEERVRRRGQAHRGAGVAVADLLHGVHREDAGGVDRPLVEVGPLELWSRAMSSQLSGWFDGPEPYSARVSSRHTVPAVARVPVGRAAGGTRLREVARAGGPCLQTRPT